MQEDPIRNHPIGVRGSGNVKTLLQDARFETIVVKEVTFEGYKVGSTHIRDLINSGQVENVTEVLGDYYSLKGEVIHGAKKGRMIGYPTANIDTGDYLIPKKGVYATMTKVAGKWYQSMSSIGHNPTLNCRVDLSVESNIFDFDQDIYGDTIALDEEAVKQNWEKIKLTEKGNVSVLGGVPKSLPALIKAMRIQEKARGVGFDWEEPEQVWDKVKEEMGEFEAEFQVGAGSKIDQEKAAAEFGDLLFSLINYARFIDINPEEALERTNIKFISRFQYLEQAAKAAGKNLSEMSLAEMDVYWEEAKKVGSTKC